MRYIYLLAWSFLALFQTADAQEVQVNPQPITASYFVDFPESITNCAVEYYKSGKQEYLYVFGGLDSTLMYSGIHRRCYKVNLLDSSIQRIQDIPDTLGKIAMAATRINDKIYLAGGYHVFANGSEKSSSIVHEFDPEGDTFTTRQIVIPVPVDDHIQFSRLHNHNRLLYLVGGWSDHGNVRNVQIFDPTTGNWGVGTPLPDDRYEFFGATGGYLDYDKLVYIGGASDQGSFPAVNYARIGEFDRLDSSKIMWSLDSTGIDTRVYRGAFFEGLFIGGSDTSYNYDATAYTNGKVLSPENRTIIYNTNKNWTYCRFDQGDSCVESTIITALSDIYRVQWPMDIRDIGASDPIWLSNCCGVNKYFLVGGILEGQHVSNKIIYLERGWGSSLDEFSNQHNIRVWPNPTQSELNISHTHTQSIQFNLYSVEGKLMKEFVVEHEGRVSLMDLSEGIYLLRSANGMYHQRIIKQ